MASIEKLKNKKGESYRIKVSLGYDDSGKQRFVRSDVIKFDNMTQRQIDRELNRMAVEFEKKVKSENTNSNGEFLDNAHVTFQELAEEWLDLMTASEKQKKASIVRLKYCRDRTYQALGRIEVQKITHRQVQGFIRSLANDGANKATGGGLSAKSQQHFLTFVSDVMNYGIKCEIIKNNPCRGVETFKISEQKEKNIYSLQEVRDILSAINIQAPLMYKTYFALTAYLGLRRAEVLGLEYKDFDFQNATVSINRTSNYQNRATGIYTGTPKTRTSRRVLAVPDVVLSLVQMLRVAQADERLKLGDLRQNTDRLFIAFNGEPMHPNIPFNWLKRFCTRNDLPFKGLHSFRHAFATQAIVNGTDVATVSAVLGHSTTSITLNTYVHAVNEANVKAVNVVADLISGDGF